jgi:transposase-like protein
MNFPCPECDSDVEYYDTASDGRSGRYRCPNCGRDTEWATGTAISVEDSIKKFKEFVDKGVKAQKEVDKILGGE